MPSRLRLGAVTEGPISRAMGSLDRAVVNTGHGRDFRGVDALLKELLKKMGPA